MEKALFFLLYPQMSLRVHHIEWPLAAAICLVAWRAKSVVSDSLRTLVLVFKQVNLVGLQHFHSVKGITSLTLRLICLAHKL